jgi:ATP-dependent Clp protease ATP-binding subunit ClpA
MTNTNRYSHHARRAMSHATTLVLRYRHADMDTGHLLVGLMLTEGCIAYTVLQEFNLSYERADPYLRAIRPQVRPLPDEVLPNKSVELALAYAADEAQWLAQHYIGTEHLLLALTRTNAGGADAILKKLNVDPEQVRRRVRHTLSDGKTEFDLQQARRAARLSELSRRVINAAEQLAVELDHTQVGVGHLLLVLLQERRSQLGPILRAAAMDEPRLRTELQIGAPEVLTSIEAALETALDHAERVGSHYTGTEHMVLALTDDPRGVAVLTHLAIDPHDLRARVTHLLTKK